MKERGDAGGNMRRQRWLQWGVVGLALIALIVVMWEPWEDSSKKAARRNPLGEIVDSLAMACYPGMDSTMFARFINDIEQSDTRRLISFSKNGISMVRLDATTGQVALQLFLHHHVEYNALTSSFQQRAASTVAAYLPHVAQTISEYPSLLLRPDVPRVALVFCWKVRGLSERRAPAEYEMIRILIRANSLMAFGEGKISLQELAKGTEFFSPIGRIEVDLASALSAPSPVKIARRSVERLDMPPKETWGCCILPERAI
jgi:hypothetical protein